MSPSGDYDDEMRAFRPGLDDEAIERLLAGTPPEELSDLAEVVDAMRLQATHRAQPSPQLAAVLSDGLTSDQREPSAPAAHDAVGAVSRGTRRPTWTRRTRMILETALAKLAALGLTAKAGVASAAVIAATTGAGAAGVLPGAVQDAVAGAVGAVTPFELPSSAQDDAEAADDAEFGERVSDDAAGDTDGEPGVDGREIADEASDGRSSDLPDEAEEGRQVAEDDRDEASSNADEAADNADEGLSEAEANAPDQGDDSIPDEVPADPSDPAAPEDADGNGGDGQETGASHAPTDLPTDGEEGQEAGAVRAPARG